MSFPLVYIIFLANPDMFIKSTLLLSKIIILSYTYAILSFSLREGFALPLLDLLLPSTGVNGIRVLLWLTLVALELMLHACAGCYF